MRQLTLTYDDGSKQTVSFEDAWAAVLLAVHEWCSRFEERGPWEGHLEELDALVSQVASLLQRDGSQNPMGDLHSQVWESTSEKPTMVLLRERVADSLSYAKRYESSTGIDRAKLANILRRRKLDFLLTD